MWLLACVFVRFLEDNALVDPPRLAGPGPRLQLARDQRTLYFQQLAKRPPNVHHRTKPFACSIAVVPASSHLKSSRSSFRACVARADKVAGS